MRVSSNAPALSRRSMMSIDRAALDLYAALKAIVAEPSLNLQADDGTELAPWLRAAYDALAKAEGRRHA